MLTPVFALSQTDDSIIVKIRAPFAKIDESEVLLEGNEILFTSKPYYLRLYLDGEVLENKDASVKYDTDTGYFTIIAPKNEPGQHFQNLEMITRLLTPRGRDTVEPSVQDISADNEKEDDWLWEQKIPSEDSPDSQEHIQAYGYGFASRTSGVFSKLQDEIQGLCEVGNPDEMSQTHRREEGFLRVQEKFDEEHYLADFFDENLVEEYLSEAVASKVQERLDKGLSEEERSRMKDLPRRRVSLSQEEESSVLASLVDILFAFAYDFRVTQGDHSVESGWTISRLSPTLSSFLQWERLRESVVASFRRSLSYPLCRNWELSNTVLTDVVSICRKGKVAVLKSLLAVHKIFAESGEFRYILNDLYITDYCLWVQFASQSIFESLSMELEKVEVKKEDMDMDLEGLELAGRLAQLSCQTEASTPFETKNSADVMEIVKKNISGSRSHCSDSDDD